MADTPKVADGSDAYVKALTDELSRQLHESPVVSRLSGLMDVSEIAARMVAAVPTGDVWDRQIGPFYDTAGLEKLRQVSRQAIHKQVQRRSILGLSAGKVTVYPAFQFTPNGGLLPGLTDVLIELDPENRDPWGDANWLMTPSEALDGETPAQALREQNISPVVRLARRAGTALWAQG